MLTLNYTYRIYSDPTEQQVMIGWLETCRLVYNHALRELKHCCKPQFVGCTTLGMRFSSISVGRMSLLFW